MVRHREVYGTTVCCSRMSCPCIMAGITYSNTNYVQRHGELKCVQHENKQLKLRKGEPVVVQQMIEIEYGREWHTSSSRRE